MPSLDIVELWLKRVSMIDMKMFFNIVTTFILAYWPILMMTSVMIFDAPDSTDNRSAILTALTIVFIPTLLALLYFLFKQSFWSMSPKTFLLGAMVVSVAAGLLFGYPKLLINNLKGVSSNGYFVKDGQVYYEGNTIEAKSVGFETIDEFQIYARDNESVFFRGKKIDSAIPKTFKSAFGDSRYYEDGQHIFYEGQIQKDTDVSTFVRMNLPDGKSSSFYKDKNCVYWFGKKISGLQPDSVKVLSETYLVDSQSVFYFQNKIEGANPNRFVVIQDQSDWGKDDKAVYGRDKAYSNIDPASFEVLERSYVKDKSKVYYNDSGSLVEVVGANPKTFTVTNWDPKTESEATDGARYYLQGKAK